MKHATLCYLIKDNKILLAKKVLGIGIGHYNGYGGKIELDETIEQSAIREILEESGVQAKKLTKSGEITYTFPENPGWDQIVHIFLVTEWNREPIDTDEMKQPTWFNIKDIPFDNMWPADRDWLPELLDGKFIKGKITYGSDKRIISISLNKDKTF